MCYLESRVRAHGDSGIRSLWAISRSIMSAAGMVRTDSTLCRAALHTPMSWTRMSTSTSSKAAGKLTRSGGSTHPSQATMKRRRQGDHTHSRRPRGLGRRHSPPPDRPRSGRLVFFCQARLRGEPEKRKEKSGNRGALLRLSPLPHFVPSSRHVPYTCSSELNSQSFQP